MTDRPTKKFDPYGTYRTDERLEVEGIVLEEPNFRIRIRRAGGKNVKYKTVTERIMRPLRRSIALGTISESVALQKTAEILAEAVIIGWETRNPNSSEDPEAAEWLKQVWHPELEEFVEPTYENIVAALVAAPTLTDYIFQQCRDESLFREQVEEDAKN